MLPLISVIIPTYNYAQFITDAISSVLQQDYPKDKIEIIVVDDGSADNTKDVLAAFISNNTVKYIYQKNQGKAGATYKAIQHATGKYILNLDADDYFLPGKIKRTVEVFESDETIVHVASPAKQIRHDGKFRIEPIPRDMLGKALNGTILLNRFINQNMLYGGGSTYAARASVLKQIVIPHAVDTYIDEFLVFAVLPFGNSFFIPDYLSVWRGHGFNYSENVQAKEAQIIKGKRLLKSSDAVLAYLKKENFDKKLVKTYRLKNLTRKISHKESLQQKTTRDVAVYAFEVFFKLRPGLKQIKNYHVLNRLIPARVFNFLKNSFVKPKQKFLFTQ